MPANHLVAGMARSYKMTLPMGSPASFKGSALIMAQADAYRALAEVFRLIRY